VYRTNLIAQQSVRRSWEGRVLPDDRFPRDIKRLFIQKIIEAEKYFIKDKRLRLNICPCLLRPKGSDSGLNHLHVRNPLCDYVPPNLIHTYVTNKCAGEPTPNPRSVDDTANHPNGLCTWVKERGRSIAVFASQLPFNGLCVSDGANVGLCSRKYNAISEAGWLTT